MTATLDQFSNTVGLIYEAGLDPDKWPIALEAISQEVNADKAQLLYVDNREQMILFASSYGFDPFTNDINAGRFRRYLPQDPITIYGITHPNEVFSDRRILDTEALHATPMYQDIRRPEDMEYMLTASLNDGSDDWTSIIFFRSFFV